MQRCIFNKFLILLPFGISLFVGLPTADAEGEVLQQLIDETAEGEVLELEAKTYEGNIYIKKPITIIGQEGTRIKGDGTKTVIEIEAEDVVLDTLHVSHSGMDQSSDEEYSGIRVMDHRATIKNVTISDVYHGITLSRANDTVIDNVHVIGQQTESLAQQGNGITIIRSEHATITDSVIEKTRDGIYVEYADNNLVTNNKVTETRYGLHYMYSDYNTFKENEFVKNVGGAAIMHSDHLILEDNSFSFNQGSRSFGLIIQSSRDIEVFQNQFYLNQRGLYLEQATSNRIEENEFFNNQIGVEIWNSSTAHVFVKNTFKKNNMDVATIGGESNNEWFERGIGNYWDQPMMDLDEDGIGDNAHLSTSAIGDLLEENELTYMFLNSPALGIYEMTKSITSDQAVMAEDIHPLVRESSTFNYAWLVGLVIGFGVLIYARRRRRA